MFNGILPHLNAMRAIVNDCRTDNIAHCYVFCSADALLLDAFSEECVYAVLGGSTHADALWRKVAGRTHSDVLYFPRENKNFNKDEFESLMTEIGYAPIDGTRRIFVIEHGELMLPLIQNRILKTLEEPQHGYVFILKTSTLAPLLPTVLSRARVLELGSLRTDDVEQGLREVLSAASETAAPKKTAAKTAKAEDPGAANDIRWAAQYADGNITKARDLVSKPEYRGMCEFAWDFLTRCNSSRDLLPYVDRMTGYESNTEELLGFFADALRDILAYLTAGERAVLAQDRLTALKGIASGFSIEAASSAIDRVETALARLAAHDNKMSVADSFLFGILEDKSRRPAQEKEL